jgi:hypothetical protein
LRKRLWCARTIEDPEQKTLDQAGVVRDVSEARVSKLHTRARCVCALSIQRLEGGRLRLRRMRARGTRSNGYGNSIFSLICKLLVLRYLENEHAIRLHPSFRAFLSRYSHDPAQTRGRKSPPRFRISGPIHRLYLAEHFVGAGDFYAARVEAVEDLAARPVAHRRLLHPRSGAV